MINPLQFLEVPESSTLMVLEADPRVTAEGASNWTQAGLITRTVRGSKMRSKEALMDEVSAALQFPYYFGQNWDALTDCLSDLDWAPSAQGIILLMTNVAEVLVDEGPEARAIFVKVLATAIETYAAPVRLGEWWDRPAVPFHVVLQTSPDATGNTSHRWTSAGAQLGHLSNS